MSTVSVEFNRNHNQLCLDHVLSSQAELGPKIPDGGYGWIIALASSFFQILIPSLTVGYGTIILYTQLENGISTNPKLWDMNITYAPLFFISILTLTEPWCRYIVLDSTWPRLVSVGGTCLSSAGLLILWIAINNRTSVVLYATAGSVSGFGASLLLTQVDIIISQYFCTKLQIVKAMLSIFTALGFIMTPIILGHTILRTGVLQCISWYQAIILQGIVISIAFKKPEYLKLHKSQYNLLKGITDEEEDIFTKSTELQSPRASVENSSKTGCTVNSEVNTNPEPQTLQEELERAGWKTFQEDSDKTQANKHSKLSVAFAVDSNSTNDKTNHFEDNYVEIPQPLFTDSHLNNNVSYSYDSAPSEVDNPVVFMPISNTTPKQKWMPDMTCFKKTTFYKTLFITVTLKYSIFLLWTLFPSYLYIKVDYLKVHHTTVVVGSVGIVGLVFSIIATLLRTNTWLCGIMIPAYYWIGAIGCLILSDSKIEVSFIIGVILLIINITSLQIVAIPQLKFNFQGEQSSEHFFISTITTIFLILLLGIDVSYQNCFRMLAIFHFIGGSLYCSNIIYKKIKTCIRSH